MSGKPEPERPSVTTSTVWLLGAVALIGVAMVVARATGGQAEPEQEVVVAQPRDPEAPERLRVHVVRAYPHDRSSFTQGLLWYEGNLYESAGQYGHSNLRRVSLEDGAVLERRELPRTIFAEGLARVDDRLIQLSWQEGEARVWSLPAMEPAGSFTYEGEGWGLCFDGTHLVMSDGSEHLVFRDPNTFEEVRRVTVREYGEPIDQLNELECVDGAVWANIWQTDRIVRIDPSSGRVTAIVDARDLLSARERRDADVLNGIAWIPERGHFVITGKLWPRLFEVEFVPRTRP